MKHQPAVEILRMAKIICNPDILFGKPVIEGTRISVRLILEKLACGETQANLLEAHPRLTPEEIRAALAFAAQTLQSDFVYPTAS
jgi:uncharacterized protein (DUF433 family)